MLAIVTASSFGLVSIYILYKIAISFDLFLLIGSLIYVTRAIAFNIIFVVAISLSTAVTAEVNAHTSIKIKKKMKNIYHQSKRTGSVINKCLNKPHLDDISIRKVNSEFSLLISKFWRRGDSDARKFLILAGTVFLSSESMQQWNNIRSNRIWLEYHLYGTFSKITSIHAISAAWRNFSFCHCWLRRAVFFFFYFLFFARCVHVISTYML